MDKGKLGSVLLFIEKLYLFPNDQLTCAFNDS